MKRKQEAIEKKEAALAKKKELLEKKELAKKNKEDAALKKKVHLFTTSFLLGLLPLTAKLALSRERPRKPKTRKKIGLSRETTRKCSWCLVPR